MALKPFSRHSKTEADTEAVLDEDDGVDQFFSKGPRPFSNESRPPQEAADQNPVPVAQPIDAPESADAGWYPDASDLELKRYWDGHHWTGQTMKVVPERRRTGGPVSAPTPDPAPASQSSSGAVVRAPDLLMPSQISVPEQPAVPEQAVAPEQAVVPDLPVVPNQIAVPEEPDRSPSLEAASTAPEVTIPPSVEAETVSPNPVQPPAAPAPSFGQTAEAGNGTQAGAARSAQDSVATTESTQNTDRAMATTMTKSPPEANREADRWFAEVARAVQRAQETESPEAWEEASRVAVVVSEVAQTMRVMAVAQLEAQAAAQRAQEATQSAALAEKSAAEANDTVTQTAKTARIAADEAQAAARAAEEAKRIAERAALQVPKSAGLAKVAAQVAADAEITAKGIGEIVAKARLANTQEAWSEALGLVTRGSETIRDLTNGSDTAV